ncbi:MAG: DUF2065 domain-containing protein [Mangrovicoccus sp.]|nr:DUF2065 domain-containing protein [Mangrovicoccus sp.]
MSTLILAVGFVLVFEGLLFALLPGRLDDLAALLAQMPVESRRLLGLTALAIGVALLWLSKALMG